MSTLLCLFLAIIAFFFYFFIGQICLILFSCFFLQKRSLKSVISYYKDRHELPREIKEDFPAIIVWPLLLFPILFSYIWNIIEKINKKFLSFILLKILSPKKINNERYFQS